MKPASNRIPQCILFVLSILFVCTLLLSQFTAQTTGIISATENEPGPGLSVEQQRRNQPGTPSSQAGSSSQAALQFTVEEGKSKPDRISLNSPCAALHRFRVRSSSEFFQLERQADSVTLGANSPKELAVNINAEGLKPGVYRSVVSGECLDCANDRFCAQTGIGLAALVTVIKSSSPTLTPTPQLTPTPANDEVEKLSREGPQFPVSFNPNDFTFRAFVKGGWPLFFDYVLTQPATVTLTVSVDGFPPLIYEFQGMNAGRHEEYIKLPNQLGGLGVASYSIKAVGVQSAKPLSGRPTANGAEAFVIRSLTAGGKSGVSSGAERVNFSPRDERLIRGQSFTNAVYNLLPVGVQADMSAGIDSVTFGPRVVKLIRSGPCRNVKYTFQTLLAFNGGATGDIELSEDDGYFERVSRQYYNGSLNDGDTVHGSWDCMKDGRASPGWHRVFVRAWFTIQSGGPWAIGKSSLVLVQR